MEQEREPIGYDLDIVCLYCKARIGDFEGASSEMGLMVPLEPQLRHCDEYHPGRMPYVSIAFRYHGDCRGCSGGGVFYLDMHSISGKVVKRISVPCRSCRKEEFVKKAQLRCPHCNASGIAMQPEATRVCRCVIETCLKEQLGL